MPKLVFVPFETEDIAPTEDDDDDDEDVVEADDVDGRTENDVDGVDFDGALVGVVVGDVAINFVVAVDAVVDVGVENWVNVALQVFKLS